MIQQFEIPLSGNLCIYRFIGEDLLNSFMNDNSKQKTWFLFTKHPQSSLTRDKMHWNNAFMHLIFFFLLFVSALPHLLSTQVWLTMDALRKQCNFHGAITTHKKLFAQLSHGYGSNSKKERDF